LQTQLRVFLPFQLTLKFSRFRDRRHFSLGHKPDAAAETCRSVIAATAVFLEPARQIISRADVVASRSALQNINPGHIQMMGWVGLEPTTNALKGRCSTIELPTRALSRNRWAFEWQPTPNAFGAALPLSYQPVDQVLTAEFSNGNQPRKPSGLLYLYHSSPFPRTGNAMLTDVPRSLVVMSTRPL
jgi:hypothetical protein